MGSKQTTTQDTKKDPWAPAVPALNTVIDRAQGIASDSSNFTPMVSGLTQGSINALGALGQGPSFGAGVLTNAVNGLTSGLTPAMAGLSATASGANLNGNPYLDATLKKAMEDSAAGVNSQFSAAGRYGSGAHTGALARELGGLETNARMDNYNTERGLQQQAQGILGQYGITGAQLAPGVDQAKAAQIGYGLTAGSLQDQIDTANKQALNGMAGTQYLGGIAVPIAGLGGQQSGTTTQTQQPSTAAMLGGAAMTGLGLMTSPMSSFMGTAANPSLFGKMMG